jgi:myxalamid-type nonribosomal peptide synthetase MxaA
MVPDSPRILNVIPIDYAARAITHISRQEASLGKNFHLWNLNPVTINQVYEWIRSFGYKFDIAPYKTVRQRIVNVDSDHPLYPLLPLFSSEEEHVPLALEPRIQEMIDPRIECLNTLKALEKSGIECPPMTEELTHRCFSYLVDRKYLKAPGE